MYRQTIKITSFCFAAAMLAIASAQASHDSTLSIAAVEYREAVVDFERSVHRSHHANRHQKRIVDDLEDATSRLVSAARNPHKSERLFYAWQQVQHLQRHVEAGIFFDSRSPLAIELAAYWYRVLRSYDCVAYEIAKCRGHGGYGYPPIIIPPVAQLSGSNHPSQWNPNQGPYVAPYVPENPQVHFRPHIQYWKKTSNSEPEPRHRTNDSVQVGAKIQRFSR